MQLLIQCERALEVGAERLLDDEPAPPIGLVGQARLRDRLGGAGEHARREREIEDRRAVEHVTELPHGLDRDVAAVEVDTVDESVHVLLVDTVAAYVHRRAQVLVELVRRPVLPRVADDAQVREPFPKLERQQRREEQAPRQVARCADHDEGGLVIHSTPLRMRRRPQVRTLGACGGRGLRSTEGKRLSP